RHPSTRSPSVSARKQGGLERALFCRNFPRTIGLAAECYFVPGRLGNVLRFYRVKSVAALLTLHLCAFQQCHGAGIAAVHIAPWNDRAVGLPLHSPTCCLLHHVEVGLGQPEVTRK